MEISTALSRKEFMTWWFLPPATLTIPLMGVSVTDYGATYLNIKLARDPKTGLTPDPEVPEFHIYPNPATGSIYIEPHILSHGPLEIRVYSADGHIHLHRNFSYIGHPSLWKLKRFPGDYISSGPPQDNFPGVCDSFINRPCQCLSLRSSFTLFVT